MGIDLPFAQAQELATGVLLQLSATYVPVAVLVQQVQLSSVQRRTLPVRVGHTSICSQSRQLTRTSHGEANDDL